jgi:predicted nucleic acid-binding protein
VAGRVNGSLLDTSVLMARNATAEMGLPATAAISVITLGELRAGVLIARDEAVAELRGRRLAAIRAAFAPLPVDESVAEHYGAVLAVARSQRRTAKATDLLIIATAAATERTLYTLDGAQARLAQAAGVVTKML